MGAVAKSGFALAMVFLVVGGFAWGWMAVTGKDLVSRVLGKRAWIVYTLVGLSALWVGFSRDTYLPFLGRSVFPCALLKNQAPEGANTEVIVQVRPGAKVLYWGAEPDTEFLKRIKNWKDAYMRYENAGVTTADDTGRAVLRMRKPQAYTVPSKGLLPPHVHYRVCMNDGVIGHVQTKMLSEEEGFQNPPPAVAPTPTAPDAMVAEPLPRPVDILQQQQQAAGTAATPAVVPDVPVVPAPSPATEGFMEYVASPSALAPRMPARSENRLYSIAESVEQRAARINTIGVDESPQIAGSPLMLAYGRLQ